MSATPDEFTKSFPPASTDMALKMTVLPPAIDSVPPFTVKTAVLHPHLAAEGDRALDVSQAPVYVVKPDGGRRRGAPRELSGSDRRSRRSRGRPTAGRSGSGTRGQLGRAWTRWERAVSWPTKLPLAAGYVAGTLEFTGRCCCSLWTVVREPAELTDGGARRIGDQAGRLRLARIALVPVQAPADPSESLNAMPGPLGLAISTRVPFDPASMALQRVRFNATSAGRTELGPRLAPNRATLWTEYRRSWPPATPPKMCACGRLIETASRSHGPRRCRRRSPVARRARGRSPA